MICDTSLISLAYKGEPIDPRLFTCWYKGCRRLYAYYVNIGRDSGFVANLAHDTEEKNVRVARCNNNNGGWRQILLASPLLLVVFAGLSGLNVDRGHQAPSQLNDALNRGKGCELALRTIPIAPRSTRFPTSDSIHPTTTRRSVSQGRM